MGDDPAVSAAPQAREALERLRRGEPYAGEYRAFLAADGAPDPAALDLLERALRETEGDARGEVARALVATAQRSDPLWQEGGAVVRDPRVVATLVSAGGLQLDDAKEVCYDALLYAVPRHLLRPHTAALLDDLRRNPDATTFLIVARLHDDRAAPVVAALQEQDPTWLRTTEAQCCAAAYGDRLTELSAVERFVATTSPREKSALARELGWMGTRLALRALGEALRTPLVHDDFPLRHSCRVEVVAGLRVTYTDAVPLFENRFTSDAAYDEAERFVTEVLGVTWTEPRPPFLWKETQVH